MRRARLASLIEQGIEPYPALVDRTHLIGDVLTSFTAFESAAQVVTIAGRLTALRQMGGLTFLRLVDDSGNMQVVLKEDEVGNAQYKFFIDHADVGDFWGFTGGMYVTQKGEQSVLATSFVILSKALSPLPDKWSGLQDVEQRYRHRELDLISNAEVKQRFVVRSKIVSTMRRFLDAQGFLEVETPMLQPIPGGASAKPFITHHNALDADLYLRIAPELYLKRLVVGGFEKIYEIGRCFRNEGIDYAHNPEFTMMELYWAYAGKDEFVTMLEQLIINIVSTSFGGLVVPYGEGSIDFGAPWKQVTFRQAIIDACGIDIDAVKSVADLMPFIKAAKLKIDFKGCVGLGEHFDQLYKKTARAAITQPTWVFDYPIELKPLTKAKPGEPSKSSSVQLVIQGAEIVNAYYYELNDPLDQRARFEEQQKLRDAGSEEAQWLDEDFLQALEHAMPPTSGVGIGIDRLVAFLTNSPSLKEVILFPTLKPINPAL